MAKIIVVGSCGHAKVLIDCIEVEGRHRVVGLLDSFRAVGEKTAGYRVIGRPDEIGSLREGYGFLGVVVAVGDNWLRRELVREVQARCPGVEFPVCRHPSAQVSRSALIGPGTVLLAGAVVNCCSRIGEFCILNTNSSLDHDSVMGDFSSLAPGATVGGRARLGEFAAIGIGACVIQDRSVGAHTIIGAGAAIIEDISDHVVAYGVPARVIRRRDEGERYL